MPGRAHVYVFIAAMAVGLFFAAFSTYDFVQHLDRQVHDLHCSFVPGLAAADSDETGCQVTMMSPYSSVMRRTVWGGIPISLPAMAVFAFLLYRGIDLRSRPIPERKPAALVLLIMATIPVIATAVMGYIAYAELQAACKLCIGIYTASLLGFLAAGLAYSALRHDPPEGEPGTGGVFFAASAQLGAFVALPVLAYVALMPDYSRYVGTCGRIDATDDAGVLVSMDDRDRGTDVIEVFDPLCPACRAFESRLHASGLEQQIARRGLLFPLDDTCNWMVDQALHPGACTVSEAVLCADQGKGTRPRDVITWAFEEQRALLEAGKTDPQLVHDRVVQRFPALEACVGSAEVRAKLGKAMRWAVKHSLPVMTPQVYVEGTKLCPEDTDLGLEYTLSNLLARPGVTR